MNIFYLIGPRRPITTYVTDSSRRGETVRFYSRNTELDRPYKFNVLWLVIYYGLQRSSRGKLPPKHDIIVLYTSLFAFRIGNAFTA